jgi:hypothetical protein
MVGSVVAGGNLNDLGLRFNRYAISYTPKNSKDIDESRHEIRLAWPVIQPDYLDESGPVILIWDSSDVN